MSVQKKSLISSRPAENKPTTEPVRETAAIGASKGLTANALKRTVHKTADVLTRHTLRASGGAAFRTMKKKK